MANDLDTLRPEVRAALDDIDDAFAKDVGYASPTPIIRAELLRLAAKEHAWQQWIKDGMRVEFLPPETPK